MSILKSTILGGLLLGSLSVDAQHTLTNYNSSIRATHASSGRALTVGISSINNYAPGTTMDLIFDLTLQTPDFEYGDSVAIVFPAGFTVNNGSDSIAIATEGQASEALNLPISSPLISWGDNDNTYGGIEPGTHTFFVNVTIAANVTGPQTITWHVDGDEYGAAPNFYAGSSVIQELASTPDLMVQGFSSNNFAQIPKNLTYEFQMASLVMNAGASLTSPTNLVASSGTLAYLDSLQLSNPLITNQIDTILLTDITTNSTVGSHMVLFNASVNNDANPMDNSDTLYINVTDSALSYSDTITDGSLSLGDGADGILGSFFNIPTTENLTSVSIYSPAPDVTNSISVVVFDRDMTTGNPNMLLWESDTVAVTGTGAVVMNFPVGLNLTGGNDYFIGVREQLTGGCSVGTNSGNYQQFTHYAYFQNSWSDIGQFNFFVSLAITPNFGGGAVVAPDTCVAMFSSQVDANDAYIYSFTNSSTTTGNDPLVYAWDFGDGNTSSMENPTHTFDTVGTFNVCLTVSSADCSDNFCLDVTVSDTSTSVNEVLVNQVKMYPNPAKQQITVRTESTMSFEILTLSGSVIVPAKTINGTATIDVSQLANGLYLVRLSNDSYQEVKRLSIVK